MAVGSNSLGLLFKIDVDAGNAAQHIQDMMNSLSQAQRQLVSKELTGSLAALNEELKNNKSLTDEQKDAIKAAIEVVKQYKTAIDDTSKAAKEHQTAVSQTVTHVTALKNAFQSLVQGNFGSAISGIGRALASGNPVMIAFVAAVVAAGVAILTTKAAIDGLVDAADKVGTDSKEDFEKLREELGRVGTQLTIADHALAQGLNQSFKDLKSEVTALFVDVLRPAGPAIIGLINEVTKALQDAEPLVKRLADLLTTSIIAATALVKTMREFKAVDLPVPGASAAANAIQFSSLLSANFELARKQYEALAKSLAGQTGTFEDTTKAVKDLTAAQLAENEAARELALIQAQSAKAQAEIDRQLKAGAITPEEALGRRLAIEQNIRNAEDALFDAQQKRIEADVKGERRRTDALEENANQRKIIEEKSAADQAAIHAKAADDLNKLNDDLIDDAIELDKKERELVDERNTFRIKSEIETQKAIKDATPVEPEGGGVGAGIIQGIRDQADALGPVTKAWREFKFEIGDALESSGIGFKGWSQFVTDAIKGVIDATQQLLTTFILTGKGGAAAFKALAAGIIASLAVQAGVEAILEVARGLRELANAAADAVTAPWKVPNDLLSAHMHFSSAAMFGIVAGGAVGAAVAIGASGGLSGGGGAGAAAAGGGFGGSTEAPGTVTINQGSPGMLGIQLLSDIHNMLSTASPGDVVTRGAAQNPVAIGQANNEASRRDGSISREFLQISGLRTA